MSSAIGQERALSPRKRQIMAVAADRFRDLGFHNVGIDDIADELGLTGPALYRHFRGKQDLLEATISSAVDELTAANGQEHEELRDLLDAITAASVDHRSSIVLWLRESRHLADERRRSIRSRFRDSLDPLRRQIAALRPELGVPEVELLVWGCEAVSPVLGSVPPSSSRVGCASSWCSRPWRCVTRRSLPSPPPVRRRRSRPSHFPPHAARRCWWRPPGSSPVRAMRG